MEELVVIRKARHRLLSGCVACCAVFFSGCPQNPYFTAQQPTLWQQQQQPQYAAQLTELQRRVTLLDDNNRQLHTQVAQAEQQAQVYRNEVDVVRQQLAATARDLENTRMAATNAQQQLGSLQASVTPKGSASLAANTTLKRIAENVDLGGLPVEYQGDVARIRIRTDQLFQPGTAQMLPTAAAILDPIAVAIPKAFARQKIGVEGYTDDRPTFGGMFNSAHQLTAAQSLAVFDYLTRRATFPPQQLFTMSQGSNSPRAANDTAQGREANRRIELVIYPDTF